MKKKLIAVAAMTAMLSMALMGCSGKKECDICGEKAKCESYELLGEKINICGDCMDSLNSLGSLF